MKIHEIAGTNHPNGEPIEMTMVLDHLTISEEASLLERTMG